MQSVGTRLREARIKKGYTLEEINARTRISLKNLNAIESDDLAKISSPFTYRSFVKQVADLVGVDHATLSADAQTASSSMPEPLVPGQEEEVYVRPHQHRKQPKPKTAWNWLRFASIAGVAGVVSVYLIWRNGGVTANRLPANTLPASSHVAAPEEPNASVLQTVAPAQHKVEQTPAAQPQTAKIEQQPEMIAPPPPGTEQLLVPSPVSSHSEKSNRVVPTSSAPIAQSAVADSDTAIHIELSAIQPTWLSISADGKTTYSGTLAAMKTMSFDGRETAQIRTANAGGVNIIFNGRALGSLGRRGQSRTFVFTKSGYEVVRGLGSIALPRTGG